MILFRTLFALIAALAVSAAPALARDSYVEDGASMFSAATVANLNQTITQFHSQTGKEVVVVTVSSLAGKPIANAAEDAFAQRQVNGVLIYLAKAEKQDGIIGDTASQRFFPASTFTTIRQAMRGDFRTGDFDAGITTGVNLVLAQYRSHVSSAPGERAAGNPVSAPVAAQTGGFHMSLFWLILILVGLFLIIRAVFRALAGPRMYPPGNSGPMGGPGYGQGPGYGGGFGGGGFGGGGFFSGLLGGLGGAFLGNELFGRGQGVIGGGGLGQGSFDQGNGGADSGGWQADPGQADMSNASFGDFGGGGFDAGGGGGFDAGGGGDGGGGW